METICGRNCSSGEVTPWQAAKWLGALDVTDTVQSVPVRLGCVLEKSKASSTIAQFSSRAHGAHVQQF